MPKRWHSAALDYIDSWLAFQMRRTEQPGCSVAIAYQGDVLFAKAYGYANSGKKTKLRPNHRFRVASHSKTFTAAGVLRLREAGQLRLDDPIGRFVPRLQKDVAAVTLAQLLSHSAGLVRDGYDSGQWVDRRPFLDRDELLKDLRKGTTIDANTRFKYSNHGFGLVGLAIEEITGEPYETWIAREVVRASGLRQTYPDMPIPRKTPFANGHTPRFPDPVRRIIPADNPTHALAAATGFVSTARDLVRFYSQLDPRADSPILNATSRREMTRVHWRDSGPGGRGEYGLGVSRLKIGDWQTLGHGGGFQGCLTRTGTVPKAELTVSVLTNAADGFSGPWFEGILHILRAFSKHGAPSKTKSEWSGRWWSLWGPVDFVPTGGPILLADPSQANPVAGAGEVEVTGRNSGKIVEDGGFGNHGETVLRQRSKSGATTGIRLAGIDLVSERKYTRELSKRYKRKG